MAMFYVKNKDGITVFINGRAVNQNQDHINYKKLIDALKANDEQKVETLLSIVDTIKSNVETIGGKANRITIDNSAIYYQDVNGNKGSCNEINKAVEIFRTCYPNVALLTVTPATLTGSKRATGVNAPVRPT